MKPHNLHPKRYLLILAFMFGLVGLYPLHAQSGADNFKNLCQSCHRLDYKSTVGPGLAGLKDRRSAEWIRSWILDSQKLIASGDADAKAVFDKYNQIAMPAFAQLEGQPLEDLIAYIESEGAKAGPPPSAAPAAGGTAAPAAAGPNTADPVGVLMGDVTIWAALLMVILALVAWRLKSHTRNMAEGNGQFDHPHGPQYLGFHFLMLTLAASGIVFILVRAFMVGSPIINTLAFMALPYVAMASFIFGSYYRYKNRGFSVSSLSSQFLEGRQLFWGSQPFHWGLVFLFFGHLIAFLFPRAVMAWNGMPVRLLILEISSLVFALSALVGLFNLVARRFSSKRLVVVASKADMLVYVVLFIQILSGIGVAVFARWGSNWFAAVLTPYLRSILYFNPEMDAVAAMPWIVKLHIVSAFFIIAIIPFTRFMHFLVAPVGYLWRSYQLVIWNYNRRIIRTSTQHTFGKKSRNH